jgi:flagellar M-ring protein FliF
MSTPSVQATAAATLQPAGGAVVASSPLGALVTKLPFAAQMRRNPKIPAIIAAAVAVALMAVLYMWTRQPEYRVLYSNVSDRDGGEIVTALTQMNVPYKFTDGGGAILVPAESVHEARLHLAQQGLPKGGSVGFELMDNQKFGISQFAEQINYQRALEGELERTIASVASVSRARVHLAIPKQTVFVREKQSPSASVLVDMYAGRVLDEGQVNAIAHMIASAVPDMPLRNISIVDQNGNLLTSPHAGADGLDATQLKYVQQVEQNTAERIQAILVPLFGAGNVRSQVSADIDFSKNEQTAESYQPNQTPDQAAVLSQQTSEARDAGANATGGVPGALSNTPPQPASAPVTNAPAAASGASGAGIVSGPSSMRKDVTTNYQVDRTISHTEQGVGGVRRLSVAVVVNYRREVDAKGNAKMQPLPAAQVAQIEALVKEAMGYSTKRGDSINVVNSAFNDDALLDPKLPVWKQPENVEMAKVGGRYLVMGIVALYLFFGLWRPAMKKLLGPSSQSEAGKAGEVGTVTTTDADGATVTITPNGDPNATLPAPDAPPVKSEFEKQLEIAREIARQDPKIVATVIKNWIADER